MRNQHSFASAFLALRDFEKLEGAGFFPSLFASMFLNFRGSIHKGHKGHDKFSDKSREQQEFFMSLSALIIDQLWPIHQFSVYVSSTI